MDEDREDFKFRFLELKTPFWDYTRTHDVTPSKAIRHFIKNGLSGNSGFTIEQQQALLEEIAQVKRAHIAVGTNLNQISKYFNIHDHLIESDLHKSHKEIIQNQKQLTRLINAVMAKL